MLYGNEIVGKDWESRMRVWRMCMLCFQGLVRNGVCKFIPWVATVSFDMKELEVVDLRSILE